MKTLVLDTNIVSYLMKGHSLADAYAPRLEGHQLAISFMTVAELHEGALRANWGRRRMELLELAIRRHVLIPASYEISVLWARVRLSRRLQPISSEDAWIAACAIAMNCPLVTHDAEDFSGIPGLELITA